MRSRQTNETFKIPGRLSPEEAVTMLVNGRLGAWDYAGATQETVDGYLRTGGSSDYVKAVAEKNAAVVADALFIPGWQGVESMAHYAELAKESNATVLESRILTHTSGSPQDRETPRSRTSVDSTELTAITGNIVTLIVDATEHDSSDLISGDALPSNRNGDRVLI
jgi:hypothetical protein